LGHKKGILFVKYLAPAFLKVLFGNFWGFGLNWSDLCIGPAEQKSKLLLVLILVILAIVEVVCCYGLHRELSVHATVHVAIVV